MIDDDDDDDDDDVGLLVSCTSFGCWPRPLCMTVCSSCCVLPMKTVLSVCVNCWWQLVKNWTTSSPRYNKRPVSAASSHFWHSPLSIVSAVKTTWHSATVVSAEPFLHGTGTLCLEKEMATYTDLCPCGEIQTMSHIVKSCPDKTEWRVISATLCRWRHVSWLTSYGSWNTYKKKTVLKSNLMHCKWTLTGTWKWFNGTQQHQWILLLNTQNWYKQQMNWFSTTYQLALCITNWQQL